VKVVKDLEQDYINTYAQGFVITITKRSYPLLYRGVDMSSK